MGRYFSGDIEGKLWFGVQSSNDADFFGSTGYQPSELIYEFGKAHLEDINKGIKICLEKLGKYKEKLDIFFKDREGYSDEDIKKEFKISSRKVRDLLEWYARLELGEKIKKCVEENGYCSFTTEC